MFQNYLLGILNFGIPCSDVINSTRMSVSSALTFDWTMNGQVNCGSNYKCVSIIPCLVTIPFSKNVIDRRFISSTLLWGLSAIAFLYDASFIKTYLNIPAQTFVSLLWS